MSNIVTSKEDHPLNRPLKPVKSFGEILLADKPLQHYAPVIGGHLNGTFKEPPPDLNEMFIGADLLPVMQQSRLPEFAEYAIYRWIPLRKAWVWFKTDYYGTQADLIEDLKRIKERGDRA